MSFEVQPQAIAEMVRAEYRVNHSDLGVSMSVRLSVSVSVSVSGLGLG